MCHVPDLDPSDKRPSDAHWIFGYGSNMHVPDLERWLGEKGYAVDGMLRVEAVVMPGYELVWNYFSRVRAGAAANVRARAGAELRGVALQVTPELFGAIDIKEGHPGRYHRGDAPRPARLQRSGESIQAWLYQVQPAYLSDGFVPPRRQYLALMIEAATEHGLGDDYVAALRQVATV